jgi:hypothetical protein
MLTVQSVGIPSYSTTMFAFVRWINTVGRRSSPTTLRVIPGPVLMMPLPGSSAPVCAPVLRSSVHKFAGQVGGGGGCMAAPLGAALAVVAVSPAKIAKVTRVRVKHRNVAGIFILHLHTESPSRAGTLIRKRPVTSIALSRRVQNRSDGLLDQTAIPTLREGEPARHRRVHEYWALKVDRRSSADKEWIATNPTTDGYLRACW